MNRGDVAVCVVGEGDVLDRALGHRLCKEKVEVAVDHAPVAPLIIAEFDAPVVDGRGSEGGAGIGDIRAAVPLRGRGHRGRAGVPVYGSE